MKHSKAILPLAYLPPIEYFLWYCIVDSAIIDIYEHYIKQTYRNRCCIYGANGKLSLTVPVIKSTGNHTLMKDVLICYRQPWQQIHWRAISSAYSSSPYFLFYKDDLMLFYETPYTYLIDFNLKLLDTFLGWLGIAIHHTLTDQYKANLESYVDLRLLLNPKRKTTFNNPPYIQVFGDRFGFIPNLSIIDLLFNLGPDAGQYLHIQMNNNIENE
jgi:hypothetical protein